MEDGVTREVTKRAREKRKGGRYIKDTGGEFEYVIVTWKCD